MRGISELIFVLAAVVAQIAASAATVAFLQSDAMQNYVQTRIGCRR